MKVTKVRLQQIIMTAGCVCFLVWIGILGQQKSENEATKKTVEIVEENTEWNVQLVEDKQITVDQVFDVHIVNYPQVVVYSNNFGEVITIKTELNTWVVAGTPLVEIKIEEQRGIFSNESENLIKYAKQVANEKHEQLQRFIAEKNDNEEERLKQHNEEYNQAKSDLELAMRYAKSEVLLITAPKAGRITEILVQKGDKVEINQPLIYTRNTQSKLMQFSISSEQYVLFRDGLDKIHAMAILEDHSRVELPSSVLATMSQRAINEEGKIDVFLDLGSMFHTGEITRVEFSLPKVAVKVVPKVAVIKMEGTSYVWMVNNQNEMIKTPVNVVKENSESCFVIIGKENYNKVLLGDFNKAKEGEKVI